METVSLAFATFVLGVVLAQMVYSRLLHQYEDLLAKSRDRTESYKAWYEKARNEADRYFGYWMRKSQ